ncbi:MAG TPA: hypothetical protein VKT83_08420 [bacterium]|nr:hypothetical protein [bacterium]
MTPAAWLVARRALLDRPWRSTLLLLGYGIGVAIMIALLSVGDALLLEAKDRNLVAGGDVVVLPEGIDPAVIKVNGVTGMFLTVPNAGFLVREVLEGPRFRRDVIAAAPQISSRLLYVRARGRVVTADASAGIPSLDTQAHAARAVTDGTDSAADKTWLNPPPASLADRLDHFHQAPAPSDAGPPAAPRPPAGTGAAPSRPARARAAWVEWDYFNVLDPATGGYAYLTLMTGADPLGVVLARVKLPGAPVQDVFLPSVLLPGDISTATAEQHVGPARLSADAAGYHLAVDDPRLRVRLTIRPDRGFALPATELRLGSVVSGYVVPVARGRADGTIQAGGRILTLTNAPAFHDHNWGTWGGVSWDWGQASSDAGALVYANVHLPGGASAVRSPAGDGSGTRATMFLWRSAGAAASSAREQGGFVGALPITDVIYAGWRPGPLVDGRRVPAPSDVTIRAASGPDTATVRIRVVDALGGRPLGSPNATGTSRGTPIFLQLRGDATLRGTVGGVPVAWQGPAVSETFVRP